MKTLLLSATLTLLVSPLLSAADPWVVYEGTDGPGKGKHIVLISGDVSLRPWSSATMRYGSACITRNLITVLSGAV